MSDLLDHPLLQDITLERVIDYTVHFIQIIGIPNQFEEKSAILQLDNYRAVLPCDLYSIIQVRAYNDTQDLQKSYRYSSDSFHYGNQGKGDIGEVDLTYKVQNSIIYTSNKEGQIEVAYLALKLDEEGLPMIPYNSSFIQALELYIKKKVFTILFDQGKINQAVLQNTQQEYAWYVGQAQRDLTMPTIDQMESITNMFTKLIQTTTEHRKGFRSSGSKEYLKLQ